MTARVLVVDDDVALAEMIGLVLSSEGYEVSYCHDGAGAVDTFLQVEPDLVLLDVMLPGRDGIEICKDLRTRSDVPIVMLTARSDTSDVVAGLEAGADDYVPKPFKPKELVARVKARLRGREDQAEEHIELGDVEIDVSGHQVTRAGEEIPLTPLEFDLLVALGRAPWKVFSREELLEKVWGYRHAADTRLVNVHVQRLRAKIERDPEHPEIVITVRGVGYRAGGASA
ncbi:MAG TPA: response regulator transcription factor [Actinomyces sp.]|nr:response regulator transcription factor [Actinomyces sp.]